MSITVSKWFPLINSFTHLIWNPSAQLSVPLKNGEIKELERKHGKALCRLDGDTSVVWSCILLWQQQKQFVMRRKPLLISVICNFWVAKASKKYVGWFSFRKTWVSTSTMRRILAITLWTATAFAVVVASEETAVNEVSHFSRHAQDFSSTLHLLPI